MRLEWRGERPGRDARGESDRRGERRDERDDGYVSGGEGKEGEVRER